MNKQKGMAALLVLALLAGAFGVGFVFKKATSHVDHPIEQAAEHVLAQHGIDVDFSEDKKKKQAAK